VTSRDALERDLAQLASRFSGAAGIAAENLTTGETIALDSCEPFPTASSIKTFVLYELMRQSVAGALDLTERIAVDERHRTLGSGVLLHLAPGLAPTLRDLAVLMMAISDNTATNMLIERLSAFAINASIRAAGLTNTELFGPIDFARISTEGPEALGVATPLDFARFLARLWRGELLPEEATHTMLEIMRIQKYIEPLRRKLPADPYAREFGEPEQAWVASKTGSLSGVRAEVGLVWTPRARWSIAVMTKRGQDRRGTSDNEGALFIAAVSERVYRAWSEPREPTATRAS